jgi:hypothetical protein
MKADPNYRHNDLAGAPRFRRPRSIAEVTCLIAIVSGLVLSAVWSGLVLWGVWLFLSSW